jgi:tRNA(adenine34) deaminase
MAIMDPHVNRRELIPLPATSYAPGGRTYEFEFKPTADDYTKMGMALDQAIAAGEAGDSPIGSVLVLPDGTPIPTRTTEFSQHDVLGHAEIKGLMIARETVGRYMGGCALLTTAEPCPGCAYFLNKAQVGLIIIGATRDDAAEFFRKRSTTSRHVWADSRRPLVVVEGLRRIEAAALLTADAKKH